MPSRSGRARGRCTTSMRTRAAVKLFGDSIAANMFLLGYAYQLGHRADRRGGDRAGDRAQRRGGRDEPQRLPLRPAGGARHGGAGAHDRAGQQAHAEAADAGRDRRVPRQVSGRLPGRGAGRAVTARAWRASPRSSAARRRAARASRRRWRAATTSCWPTRTSTRSARLYSSPAFETALAEQFEAHGKLAFHLAPPLLARRDKVTGEPRKMQFGRLDAARCSACWRRAKACAARRGTCSATRPSASWSGR